MTNEVQFEEENFSRPQTFQTHSSGLTGLIIKLGLANTTEKANRMLVYVLVIILIAIGILIGPGFISSKPSGPDRATLEKMTQYMRP